MSRMIGTVSRGVRAPIIRNGDDIVKIVTESVLEASKDAGFEIRDRDIIGATEAIVARAQSNYATIDDIATDIKQKFPVDTLGVIFYPYTICPNSLFKILLLSFQSCINIEIKL